MAIIRPSAIIGAISGTLGSVDFVLPRGSSYIRRRPRKTNQKTVLELNRRNRFKFLVNQWRVLDESQRQAWRSAAALANFRNRLGTPRRISGYQLFVRENLNRRASQVAFPIPPNILASTPSPSDLSLAASASGSIVISYTITSTAGAQNIYVAGSRPVSSARRAHFSRWLWLRLETELDGPQSMILTTEWDTLLGHPVEGEYIAVRVRSHEPTKLFAPWIPTASFVTA